MAEDKKLEDFERQLAEAQKSIEALTAKNRELIDEKRSTKSGAERQLMEAQERISDLEAQVSKIGTDAKKAADRFASDLKAAQDIAGAKSQALGKLIRDEGLQRELLAVGIKNPVHLKAAQAMLRELVQVDEEKGEAYVVAKDAKGVEVRKGLSDFAKEWAQGDEGKAFVTIAPSSGGGSMGPGSGTPGVDFAKMEPSAVMDYARQGDTQAAQVRAWQKSAPAGIAS